MRLTIVESPYAGDVGTNVKYGLRALRDSLSRGEAPFASHLFYPLVLQDSIPGERAQGMSSGFAWMAQADLVAVYMDLGLSPGMEQGIAHAKALRLPIEYRWLDPRA